MSTIDDLAQLFAGQDVQKTIAADNPYLQGENTVNQIGQVVQQAAGTGKYGLGELGVGSAITGLLGGLLSGMGGNYQNTLTSRYNDTLDRLQKGETVDPESTGLSANIFQKADTNARLFKKVQELQNQQTAKDLITQAVGSGNLTTDEALAKLGATQGVAQGAAPVDNAVGAAGAPSSIESYAKARGVTLPAGVPATRQMVDALAADKEKKDAITKGLEKTTYDRIAALPEYKLLADVDSNFKALPDLAKQDSKAADIGLISTIARIRDPNSTVREGEYKINADTQSFLDSVYGNWRSVITGDSRLNSEAKKSIILSVVPKYNELVTAYSGRRGELLNALTKEGGNPANVPAANYNPYNPADVEKIFAPAANIAAQYKALRDKGMSPADAGAALGIK